MKNYISLLSDNLNINNNIINKEIKYNNGRDIAQVVNGLKEGKGTYYWINGDKYEGDFKKGYLDGKGIFYYNDGRILNVILEKINEKEEKLFIIQMVIYIKVSIKMA